MFISLALLMVKFRLGFESFTTDGYIDPWYTSLFDFFDSNEDETPMEQQKFYVYDSFGLQTLDDEGRLFRTSVDGVTHEGWLHDRDVFETYILPLIY